MLKLLQILLKILSFLPLRLIHGFGGFIGLVFYWIPNRTRDITYTNLRLVFPSITKEGLQPLVKSSLMNAGKNVTELAILWHWPFYKIKKSVREVYGMALLDSALKSGRGVLCLTPHLGCWEIVSIYLSDKFRATCLYRPPRLSGLDQTLRKQRERFGTRLVPTTASGVKALMQTLRQGDVVGLLPDQDPGKGSGIFIPFFNIPCNTLALAPRLIKSARPVVLLTFALRRDKGQGYDLHIRSVPNAVYSDDITTSATTINKAIEDAVLLAPAQYQWTYKRFKYQPDGRNFYARDKIHVPDA